MYGKSSVWKTRCKFHFNDKYHYPKISHQDNKMADDGYYFFKDDYDHIGPSQYFF